MKAMILAAGFGTRLWPLTADRTKPAIPVMGRPLVGYVAEYLAGHGYRDIVVNLHHQPDSVREAIGDGSRFGVRIEYVEEKEILGTSGALDNARHLLEGDAFVVINGKIITDINLTEALAAHKRSEALATLILLPNPKLERFSIVHVNNGLVERFGEFPNAEARYATPPLMFTGIQILEPRIFDYIPRGVFSHSTTDVYPKAIDRGEKIIAHVASGHWHELSTIDRYLEITLELLRREGKDFDIGERCAISPAASVSESILWDDVNVEKGARVYRSIIGDGVTVRAGEVIENSAVVLANLIQGHVPPPKALKGEYRGGNFVVPISRC